MIPIEITPHVCWLRAPPAEIARRTVYLAPNAGMGHAMLVRHMSTEVRASIEAEDRRLAEHANSHLIAILSR
jgi:hypothetical protein